MNRLTPGELHKMVGRTARPRDEQQADERTGRIGGGRQALAAWRGSCWRVLCRHRGGKAVPPALGASAAAMRAGAPPARRRPGHHRALRGAHRVAYGWNERGAEKTVALIEAPSPNFNARRAQPEMICCTTPAWPPGDAARSACVTTGPMSGPLPGRGRSRVSGLWRRNGAHGTPARAVEGRQESTPPRSGRDAIPARGRLQAFPETQIDAVIGARRRARADIPNDACGHSDARPAQDRPGRLFP